MGNTFVLFVALYFGKCLSDSTSKDTTSPPRGSDTSLLNMLSGNGIYNPMDPMGFIFGGNSEQYRGNGIDTPRYNPDKFAYSYAGAGFGQGANPFIPNFVNTESINSSPNYAHHSQPTKPPQEENILSNEKDEKNETSPKDESFLHLPVAAGSPQKPTIPEFASQTFPENIMSALKINASAMFPGASFSGQPGMLGIGEQRPLHAVVPGQGPIPERQYLPIGLRNVSETRIVSPIYDGLPGMEGSMQQGNLATNDINTNTPKPLYSGYPGMLGIGQMYNNMNNRNPAPQDTRDDSGSQGYSNQDRSGYRNSGVNVIESSYISAVPGVNTNNWKGEWPGKTSAGGNWSGDWADKWPKNGAQDRDEKDGTSSSQFGNSAGQTSTHRDWDGSWPGSSGKDETTKKPSHDIGNFGDTMTTLEKLMNLLNNIPEPEDQSKPRAASSSFSQMVSSWKEDMKS